MSTAPTAGRAGSPGPAWDAARLGEYLTGALERSPSAAFLVCDDRTLGPGDFLRETSAREAVLRHEMGLGPGSVAWVVGGRSSHFWVDLVACWRLGAIPVPFGELPDAELVRSALHSAPPAAVLGNFRAAGGGEVIRARAIGSDRPPAATAGQSQYADLAAVLFTSGSTGAAKAVALSHRSVLGNARATAEAIPLFPGDRLAIAVPFHYTSAICHFLAAGLAGATLVCTERRLPAGDLARFVKQAEATWFGGAPIQARWLAECAPSIGSTMRGIISSGDYLGQDVVDLLRRTLPKVRLYTVYGLTELGGRFCVLPPHLLTSHRGSVGRPVRGLRVTVLTPMGTIAKPGEVGEVCAAGDYLFSGYLDELDPYLGQLTPHGFRTGDIGRLDSDGFLVLLGREDDVFKRSGEKVSAVRIAEALMRLGLFSDAAVLPLPDPLAGHAPCAYVVVRRGHALDKGTVLALLRKQLPTNHLPVRFVQLAEIPRTASGKVRREAIRQADRCLPGGAPPTRRDSPG